VVPLCRLCLYLRLDTAQAVLLVDVAVTLLLHPVLENHGNAENEDKVDADNTKSSRKDLIEVLVGERRELANASALLRCNKGVQASSILDKRRRGRVRVAAAVELDFVSIWLHNAALAFSGVLHCGPAEPLPPHVDQSVG
jgi:hypothetical protein